MKIMILPADKFFYDSPEPGDKDCICSRCLLPIPRNNTPILRAWPTGPGDHGYDRKASTEFRYCWKCCKSIGLDFGDPDFEGEGDI